MTPREYEIAQYARAVWMLAKSGTVAELLAIACTIRNHVVPKPGGTASYDSFSEACGAFLALFPVRQPPTLQDPAFVSPNGLLSQIEDIYDCTAIDLTATHDQPGGARFFARVVEVEPESWFDLEIIKRSAVHPLLGTWGAQQFFG